MDAINHSSYLILFSATIAWCVLHSTMISVRVTQALQKNAGSHYRFYRLVFNLIAIISLVPIILYQRALQTEPFFDWDGYIFSTYLIIGSRLEERKLVMEFGDAYQHYQKTVSMLLPFKWLRSYLFRRPV